MKTALRWLAALASAALFAVSGAANAYVIAFDSLSGANADPYAGHIEGGFTVSATSGEWLEAHLFGNPVPDIFGRSNVGVVNVTGGLFTFSSVDLADAGSGGADFMIRGFLGGIEVLSQSGTDLPGSFITIASSEPAEILDRLEITMLRNVATYNIDNIVVNAAIPEPTTLALLGIALAGLGFSRRKRAVN